MTKNRKSIEAMEAIERLLIIQSLALGVKAYDIARALEIDSSGIRNIVSLKNIKKPEGNYGIERVSF